MDTFNDAFLPSLPDDVLQALMRSGEMEYLDDKDRLTLTNYLVSGNPDPAVAEMIGQALGAAGGTPGATQNLMQSSASDYTDWSATPEAQALDQRATDPGNFPTGDPMADYNLDQVYQDTPQPERLTAGMSRNPNDRFGSSDLNLPNDWRFVPPDLEMLPEGSAFRDISSADLGLYTQDPVMLAQLLATNAGANAGGAYQRAMEPYAQDALFLAEQGQLGGATNNQLQGGPASNAGQLALAEELLNTLNATKGAQIDPVSTYQGIFDRALATPENEFDMGSGGEAGDYASQINVTNSMLMQAMGAGTTPQKRDAVQRKLESVARQWLMERSRGEHMMSYPQYLQAIGARDYLG